MWNNRQEHNFKQCNSNTNAMQYFKRPFLVAHRHILWGMQFLVTAES